MSCITKILRWLGFSKVGMTDREVRAKLYYISESTGIIFGDDEIENIVKNKRECVPYIREMVSICDILGINEVCMGDIPTRGESPIEKQIPLKDDE